MPDNIRNKLNATHIKHSAVFDGDLKDGYNGNSGNFDVNSNFRGGIPPTPHQHSVPRYHSSGDDVLMQAKIDELEEQGIVVKVAETNIVPRYAAPCMLQLKHSARDLPPSLQSRRSVNITGSYCAMIN